LTSFLLPSIWALDVPMAGGKWWHKPALKDKLGLTPDQIQKIDTIWREHRKSIIDIRSDVQKAYLDLEGLMSQPTVNAEEAYRLAEGLAQLKAKQVEERMRMAIDIRQELTLEQFQKLRGSRHELGKMRRQQEPEEGKKMMRRQQEPEQGKRGRRGPSQN
jgi:Spy/CpxP family protein refolding chaperone